MSVGPVLIANLRHARPVIPKIPMASFAVALPVFLARQTTVASWMVIIPMPVAFVSLSSPAWLSEGFMLD